jgi:hypothetical protein
MFHVKHRSNGVDAVQITVTKTHLSVPDKIPLRRTAYTGAHEREETEFRRALGGKRRRQGGRLHPLVGEVF